MIYELHLVFHDISQYIIRICNRYCSGRSLSSCICITTRVTVRFRRCRNLMRVLQSRTRLLYSVRVGYIHIPTITMIVVHGIRVYCMIMRRVRLGYTMIVNKRVCLHRMAVSTIRLSCISRSSWRISNTRRVGK